MFIFSNFVWICCFPYFFYFRYFIALYIFQLVCCCSYLNWTQTLCICLIIISELCKKHPEGKIQNKDFITNPSKVTHSVVSHSDLWQKWRWRRSLNRKQHHSKSLRARVETEWLWHQANGNICADCHWVWVQGAGRGLPKGVNVGRCGERKVVLVVAGTHPAHDLWRQVADPAVGQLQLVLPPGKWNKERI